jgi:hypothetical protein
MTDTTEYHGFGLSMPEESHVDPGRKLPLRDVLRDPVEPPLPDPLEPPLPDPEPPPLPDPGEPPPPPKPV